MDALVSTAGDRHYNALDTAFMVRAFAALATETTSPGSFVSTPVEKLEAGWVQLERGVNHTITLLKDEVGLDNSAVLPSANAAAWTLPADQRRWPRTLSVAGLAGCALLAFTPPRASAVAGAGVLAVGGSSGSCGERAPAVTTAAGD